VANAVGTVTSDIFGEVVYLIKAESKYVVSSDVLNANARPVGCNVAHDPIIVNRLEFAFRREAPCDRT
jgi:hypothetical protein